MPTLINYFMPENSGDYNAVSDYQEVFRQLKLENPTASMGALQHKTMERMAELKALRLEEERRKREEFEKKEEEERLRNQSTAEKYVNRIVGKIRLPHSISSLQVHHHHDSNPSLLQYPQQLHHSNKYCHQIPPQDQSATHLHPDDSTPSDGKSFPFIAVPTGMRVSMISSSTSAARRASSALIDIPWANNGVRRRSSADSSSNSNDNKNNDAATNLAPRRSVNDMSIGGGDDDSKSFLSYRSNASGIFSNFDGDSIISGESGLHIDDIPSTRSPPLDNNSQKQQSLFNGKNDNPSSDGGVEDVSTQMLVSYQSSSGGIMDHDHQSKRDNDISSITQQQAAAEVVVVQDSFSSIIISKEEKNLDDDHSNCGEELSFDNKTSSSLSTADYSSKASVSGIDGLIVGFGDRSRIKNRIGAAAAATEDDLIVGFVDRNTIAGSNHHSRT